MHFVRYIAFPISKSPFSASLSFFLTHRVISDFRQLEAGGEEVSLNKKEGKAIDSITAATNDSHFISYDVLCLSDPRSEKSVAGREKGKRKKERTFLSPFFLSLSLANWEEMGSNDSALFVEKAARTLLYSLASEGK